METALSDKDKTFLLWLARETITKAVKRQPLPTWNEKELSAELKAKGAAFVTLTIHGDLRGCIGSLEPYQSLVDDVQEHARQAALEDYRFPPVTAHDVPFLHIEISRLTLPGTLKYNKPAELPEVLHPHVDGVILKDGFRRSTFLPQVWDQLPDPEEFLDHLCLKMGAPADTWRKKMLDVSIYHVEEFQEPL